MSDHFEGKSNDFEIYSGTDCGEEVLVLGGSAQIFTDCNITPGPFPESIEEEVVGLSRQNILSASMSFEHNRRKAIEGLRAILAFVFKKYNLPTQNGVDVGAGATGAMVENLLAPLIQKNSWAQIDVNPAAVAENKKRHPDSVICQGSYHNTEALGLNGNMEIVTGLSSLDATMFIDNAIEQLARALQSGGYLLHMQDVRPGVGIGLKELGDRGLKPPYMAKAAMSPATRSFEPVFYQLSEKLVSVGELLRTRIGRTIERTTDLELISNEWVTARRPSTDRDIYYFMNMYLQATPLRRREEISAVLTLARKK